MRSVASFNSNHHRHKTSKKFQHLRTPKLSPENGLPQVVNAVNLRDILRNQAQLLLRALLVAIISIAENLAINRRGKRGRPFQHVTSCDH
jgi:hypothetical protein